MTSVGEMLRAERVRKERTVREIADQLKISARYLEAIESDDRKVLPGSFFYKSFVRQYASALDFSNRGLLEERLALVPDDDPPPVLPGETLEYPLKPIEPIVTEYNFHSVSGSRRTGWSAAALVLVVVACSGVYAWYRQLRTEAATTTPQPVSRWTPPDTAGAQPEATKPSPAPAQPVATPAAAEVLPPATDLQDGQHILVDVAAREATWISIVSDGKQIFVGMMEPAQSKTLQGRESARIRVGNAAGIEVRLNGKPIGPLGARGQVRILQVTKDNFQILSPSQQF